MVVPEGRAHTGPLAKVLNYLRYGTPRISEFQAQGLAPTLFDPVGSTHIPAATKTVIGPAPVQVNDKLEEVAQILKPYFASSTPKTWLASELLPKRLQTIKAERRRLQAIQRQLRKHNPGGAILKLPLESQTAGNLMETGQDWLSAWKRFSKLAPDAALPLKDPALAQKLLKKEFVTLQDMHALQGTNEYQQLSRNIPGYRQYEVAQQLLHKPKEVLVQEKLPAHDEIRVVTIGRDVVGGASLPRYGRPAQALNTLGIQTPEVRKAVAQVRALLKGSKLPQGWDNTVLNMDVLPTATGAKILETNPNGWGGFLGGSKYNPANAINMHRVIGELQGQRTGLLAAPYALGAGVAGYAGIKDLAAATAPAETPEA